MANFTKEIRTTAIDYLRQQIGDEDRLVYPSDEQLDAYIRGAVWPSITTEQLNAVLGSYYSLSPCPVVDLTIISGTTAGNKYRIDEHTKFIKITSGTIPADNTSIEIKYVPVDWGKCLRTVLVDMATDAAKVALIANTGDIKMDTSTLREALLAQANAISVEAFWSQ